MSAGVIASHYVDAGGGGGGGPTRLYFASTGTPSFTPTPNAAWDQTGSQAVRPLLLASQLGAGNNTLDSGVSEFTASIVNVLKRQHITNQQVATAHTISGTFSIVLGCVENNTSADDYLQVVAYVTDSTGSTVRGVLYSGQTTNTVSTTVGDPNEEMSTSQLTRIMSGISVSPVAAQVGDRLVVEIGYRACNTLTSSFNVQFKINDQSSGTDLALASGTNVTSSTARPWIEFSDGLFV